MGFRDSAILGSYPLTMKVVITYENVSHVGSVMSMDWLSWPTSIFNSCISWTRMVAGSNPASLGVGVIFGESGTDFPQFLCAFVADEHVF